MTTSFPPTDRSEMAALDLAAELSRHRPYLVNFARRRLQDEALAEDAVQETLLAALQGTAAFEQRAALRTWLTGILLRRIADSLRYQSRRPSVGGSAGSEDEEESANDGDAAGHEPIDWIDPQRRLEGRQFLHDLHACLAELQPQAARLFTLRAIDGMSNEEAAETLGLSVRQSTVLWHRARNALKQRLGSHGEACGFAMAA